MKNARKKRPRWLVLSLLGLMQLAAIAWQGFPLLWMFGGISLTVRQINKEQAQMQTPPVYEAVGNDLAILCQSGPTFHPTGFVGTAWLPPSIRVFKPNLVSITESNAVIGKGGGFVEFYGYTLERDPSRSAPGSNYWRLVFNGDRSTGSNLHTFETATTEVLEATDFIERALAEYNREAASHKRDDIYALRVQQARINFMLQCDRKRVRDACVWAVGDMPSHSWPRLTLALFDASHGRYREAEKTLIEWVDAKPSYSRFMFLAYFYRIMEKPGEAAEAVERAITHPIVDLPDDMTNTECRGYWAGVYAFESGKYSTVAKLCEALLPVRANGDYAKAALEDLKTKALEAGGGGLVQFSPSEAMGEYNPYDVVDLASLLSR
jgi:hypothetical protein